MVSKEPWVVEKYLYDEDDVFNIVSVFHDKLVGVAYKQEDATLISKSVKMYNLLKMLSDNKAEWLNEDYFLDSGGSAEDWLDDVEDLLNTIAISDEG